MTAAEFLFGAVDYIEGLSARYEAGTVFHATAVESVAVEGAVIARVSFTCSSPDHPTVNEVADVWVEGDGSFYGEW